MKVSRIPGFSGGGSFSRQGITSKGGSGGNRESLFIRARVARKRTTVLRMSDMDPDAIMSDDPMVVKLEARCAEINGKYWNGDLGLTQLLNPSKVVNLEREIVALQAGLDSRSAKERAETEMTIAKLEAKQTMEMRGVMRDWLKAVFVWQSILSIVICGLCAYDSVPFFPHLNLAVRVLGFWGIWLFTIPSLRSRKPGGIWGMSNQEKAALDISFLLVPITNLAMPTLVGPSPEIIFWANLVVLAGCYAFGFATAGEVGGLADATLPEPIRFALKALDFGAGSERGLKMEVREKLEEKRRTEMRGAQSKLELQGERNSEVIPSGEEADSSKAGMASSTAATAGIDET